MMLTSESGMVFVKLFGGARAGGVETCSYCDWGVYISGVCALWGKCLYPLVVMAVCRPLMSERNSRAC